MKKTKNAKEMVPICFYTSQKAEGHNNIHHEDAKSMARQENNTGKGLNWLLHSEKRLRIKTKHIPGQ